MDEIIFPDFFAPRGERKTTTQDNPTPTTFEQIKVEREVQPFFKPVKKTNDHFLQFSDKAIEQNINIFEYESNPSPEANPEHFLLFRAQHIHFLKNHFSGLSSSYAGYDSSHTWMSYWTLHALQLLDAPPSKQEKQQFVTKLEKCQNKTGGFGGGFMQESHLASTYAAVAAICTLGLDEAYQIIDRKAMYRWLMSLKNPDGSFCMHIGGEVDIRGAYCAFVTAKLCGILDEHLIKGTPEWLQRCQTYEGGLSGLPGAEAHGGYTYCGFAALCIINKAETIDLNLLLEWLINRQMPFEGGFQGRANKLVDACYSFWQAACFPLLHPFVNKKTPTPSTQLYEQDGPYAYRQHHLQEYLLRCAQDSEGGLRDKPSKWADLYHTCYSLSGLSLAQSGEGIRRILGPAENMVGEIDPLYNVDPILAQQMISFFADKPLPQEGSDNNNNSK